MTTYLNMLLDRKTAKRLQISSAKLWVCLTLGSLSVLGSNPADALPGQSISEAKTWIKVNDTLKPGSNETLMVRKSDTAAHRFTFEALTTPPGRATGRNSGGIIRSEKITLFDVVNGVSRSRLEQSFQLIYGPDLYRDYEQASVVYQYPDPQTINQAENQAAPLRAAVQGEIRQGKKFAYWIETAQPPSGPAYSGQFTVFLTQDIGKLETELQSR